jgi:hypothetical protein
MDREDIVAVGIRVFAVYLALSTLYYLPYIFRLPASHTAVEWLAPAVIAVLLLVALALWFFPLTIARKLLPVMREPRAAAAIDARLALSLGIALIGVWFATAAVRPLIMSAGLYLLNRGLSDEAGANPQELVQIGSYSAQLLLGIGLALGSGGLRDLLLRARGAGPKS